MIDDILTVVWKGRKIVFREQVSGEPVFFVIAAVLALLLGLVACGENAAPDPTRTPGDAAADATPMPTEVAPAPTASVVPTPASQEHGAVEVAQTQVTFAYASPESQGLAPDALQELADVVRGYVEQDAIVGAELVVIKNRQIVLHEAMGWKDREEGIPMVRDTLFNIRSMTKPVLGTAIQMLVDEGRLALDDRASQYLPAFDNARSGAITIEHLLTHRSGLPLSLMRSFEGYANIQDVAAQAGEHGPDFVPGSRFEYSDAGSDVLGALLEQVSGVSINAFLEQRILGPLGMTDTITLIDEGDSRTERIASAYQGSKGAWSRYWRAGDEPLYRFTLGSQGLYATPLDYARFLALWMDGGVVGARRLLTPQAVERGLTPASDAGMPTSFPGLKVYYGEMWMLYGDADADAGALEKVQPVAFGHNGSDGTFAWAWPDQDLMVLYFTQSRGQGTGIKLEAEIDRLLVNPGAVEDVAAVPEEYAPYLGVYTAQSGPLQYRTYSILVQNGHLAIELPEQIVVELKPPDRAGKWQFTIEDRVAVSFNRDAAGDVVGMMLHEPGQTHELPRGTPPPEPELDLDAVEQYVGFYRGEDGGKVEVLIQNGRLALRIPDSPVPLELFPPDEEGRWYVRLNPVVSIAFNAAQDGRIESFTVYTPEEEKILVRIEGQGGN